MKHKGNEVVTPKWLAVESVRKKSQKQEKKLSKKFKGRLTINSGATLQQNDIETATHDIEAKFTDKKQYTLKLDDLDKLERRTKNGKTPIMIIEFTCANKSYVVVGLQDYIDNSDLQK